MGVRAGKNKLGVVAAKYKFGTRAGGQGQGPSKGLRAGKYKLGVRAAKYKFGARTRAGGQEIQIPVLKYCKFPKYYDQDCRLKRIGKFFGIEMDIEKAFDSLDHNFLNSTLEKYGFGKNFI